MKSIYFYLLHFHFLCFYLIILFFSDYKIRKKNCLCKDKLCKSLFVLVVQKTLFRYCLSCKDFWSLEHFSVLERSKTVEEI